MTKTFKVPFAAQGDRVSIPDEAQADGAVSYAQGYGETYGRDQNEDPTARDIEREKMNGIFHDITEAVGEMQTFGAAQWTVEAQPYPLLGLVYHKQKLWQSRIENNKEEPQAGNAWVELKADLTAADVGVYSKEESDTRFQPKGNYASAGNYALKGESYTKSESDEKYQPRGYYLENGYSYSKTESDSRYQPKGNYAPAGNYAIRGECYTKSETYSRREIDSRISPRNMASATTNGWWECGDTGIIYQWGISYQGGVIKFPKQFRTQCFSVVTNIYTDWATSSGDNQWPVFNLRTDSFQTQDNTKGWYLTWFAIGK
ncbi:gp53-like domain-containing protein [Xenorhabdus kozodoii]|uniref:Phage tail protein n=1 Tax=Xenorhabdus kozodoii TaxID=351676 RepID=A0A2D0L0R0_9GAMM|nr:phage tail protein [Xenorhabdus kozodoii]